MYLEFIFTNLVNHTENLVKFYKNRNTWCSGTLLIIFLLINNIVLYDNMELIVKLQISLR